MTGKKSGEASAGCAGTATRRRAVLFMAGSAGRQAGAALQGGEC